MKTRPNLATLTAAPWAIQPETLSRIVDWTRRADLSTPPIKAMEGEHKGPMTAGGIGVIPVYGVIEYRSSWLMEYFGGCSVEGLRESLAEALADPSITAVVLDIDSPGGSVSGVTELAAEIRAARGGSKPIIAVANTLAASAAYWLASQADEVVVTPSGQVGSIGVYAVHEDVSRMLDEMGVTMTMVSAGEHKTEGNPYEPLTDEARADIQERVDATYQQFLADVAAGRRVSAEEVEANYGGGRVLSAKAALAAGMVDRVESVGQALMRLSRPAARRRAMSAEGEAPELVADASGDDPTVPFTVSLAALAVEAEALVTHAQERSRLRAKEGRPAFSTTTERSLRSIRDAIDGLLALDEPAPSDDPPKDPGEPAPEAPSTPPKAAPIPSRFRSDDDWMRFLEASAAQ